MVSLNSSVFRLSLGELIPPAAGEACTIGVVALSECLQGIMSAEDLPEEACSKLEVHVKRKMRQVTGDQQGRTSLVLMCWCACRVAQN